MFVSIDDTKVAYIVPELVHGLAAVWDKHVMWTEGGRKYTMSEAIAFHTERVGNAVSFTHENEADPLAVAYAVADVLDRQDGTYFIAVDAHERANDGKRLLARVIVRSESCGMGRRELTLPWESGSPDLDLETLQAAGLTAKEAESLLDDLDLDIEPEPEDAPRP